VLNDQIYESIKNTGSLIGIAGSLITGIALIRNSLTPGSIKNTRELIEKSRDPIRKFSIHFTKLIKRIDSPILVFIDDLDRCKETYVVEFLEGIHTIFKNANVIYIVAADQNWIYTSYDKIYENFSLLGKESGRPLGYLFIEKIFQLLIPLAKLSLMDQKNYLEFILYNKSQNDDLKKQLDDKLQYEQDPNRLIDLVNSGTGDPIIDRNLRALVVEKLDKKEIQEKTEHFLHQFVEYFEPNPRSILRYINIFNIVRAVNILSSTNIDNQKLALWIIVALRWPNLARYLQKNPSSVDYIGNDDITIPQRIPENVQSLFKDNDVIDILKKNKQNIIIDAKTIQDIILWSL
jgi:hypothetical protein